MYRRIVLQLPVSSKKSQMLTDIGLMTTMVAFAEIGDKTQLLALCLAARFRKPLPIVAGILAATVANHLIAAWAGATFVELVDPVIMKGIIIASFVLMAVWMLIPDKLDDGAACDTKMSRYGVFAATVFLFFLAEMGDKTQLATALLGAKMQSVPAVVTGTTLAMLIADVPAVFLGEKFAAKIPFKYLRWASALIFIVFIFI